jgi:palmitoyltransferase
MSANPSDSQGPSPGQTSGSTPTSNGKDTPNEVEMKSLRPDTRRSIPIGEDVMQLARMGEIGAMQNLFTAKKFTASYRDEEGITPLHVRSRDPAQFATGKVY